MSNTYQLVFCGQYNNHMYLEKFVRIKSHTRRILLEYLPYFYTRDWLNCFAVTFRAFFSKHLCHYNFYSLTPNLRNLIKVVTWSVIFFSFLLHFVWYKNICNGNFCFVFSTRRNKLDSQPNVSFQRENAYTNIIFVQKGINLAAHDKRRSYN